MTLQNVLMREHKAMPAPLSSVGEDGLFEGYACLFGSEDLGHDIIRRGAFSNSLQRRGIDGIKLLYQHDPNQPIGHWRTIFEDERGLFVRGQLALDVEKAREVLSLMRAGILDGLSIGFRTIRANADKKSGVRHLIELDLWEISIVTFPMQPDARISSVKADARPETAIFEPTALMSKRQLERKLTQDAGLSRSQARALLASGFAGLSCKQDAALQSSGHSLAQLNRLSRAMRRAARSLASQS